MVFGRNVTIKEEIHLLETRKLHLEETILILLDQISLIEHDISNYKKSLDKEMQ